jgi:dihydroorotate dehydrogenase (NAD+) catalytic subunit
LVDLKCKIGSVEFDNPLLTASGTFGYGYDAPDNVDLLEIGGIITKSITAEERRGNPPPRIVETPCGMLNSIGLANIGLNKFIDEALPKYKTIRTNIIVNIAGSTIDEYIKVLSEIDIINTDIAGYEINISCPNVDRGGMEFGIDEKLSFDLTSKLRKVTEKLLIVKLSPNVTDITKIAIAAEEAGADAISAINTVVGMNIDINTKKPSIHQTYAGLSGPAIRPIALSMVHKISQVINIPVVGIGGVTNTEDVIQFILAGATAVQIGTANFNNPNIYKEIKNDFIKYLIKHNKKSYTELIGDLELYV